MSEQNTSGSMANMELTKDGLMRPRVVDESLCYARTVNEPAAPVSVLDLLRGDGVADMLRDETVKPHFAAQASKVIDLLEEAGAAADAQSSASYSVRRLCNVVKMLSPLLTNAINATDVAGMDAMAQRRVEVALKVTQRLLQSFSAMTETSCPGSLRYQLSQTAVQLVAGLDNVDAMDDRAIETLTNVLIAAAKADIPAPEVPFTVLADSERALQVTLLNAMTPILLEVEAFSFFRDPDECLRHAQQQILRAASDSHSVLFPEPADNDAARILMQNLVSNYARIYAKAWGCEAKRVMMQYEPLQAEGRQRFMTDLRDRNAFAAVDLAFDRSVASLLRLQCEIPAMLDEALAQKIAPAPRMKR